MRLQRIILSGINLKQRLNKQKIETLDELLKKFVSMEKDRSNLHR